MIFKYSDEVVTDCDISLDVLVECIVKNIFERLNLPQDIVEIEKGQ